MVRAGRPRSRVGILHTLNRKHGLHHAWESGKVSGSALKPVGGQRGVARVRRVGEVVHGAAVGAGGVAPPTASAFAIRLGCDSPLKGGVPPRASRPQPYFLAEAAERRHDLAVRQPAIRGDPQRQVARKPTTPTRERGRPARNPPGTRASRPQPYFLVETAERRHDLAVWQPAFRGDPQGQDPRKPTAPPRDPVAETGEAVPGNGAGGTPAFPGGHPPHLIPFWRTEARGRVSSTNLAELAAAGPCGRLEPAQRLPGGPA